MIISAYKELVSKINEIKDLYSSYLSDKMLKSKVESKWKAYTPNHRIARLIAVDGGELVKDIRLSSFYLVDAEAVKTQGKTTIVLEGKSNFGILMSKKGKELDKKIASLIMQLLELKLAYKYGNDADYILLDGSLTKKIGSEEFKDKDPTLDEIEVEDKIYSLDKCREEEDLIRCLIAENHVILTKLIEKYSDKLLFISKASRSRELFNEKISDMALLDLFIAEPGYSEIITKEIDRTNLLSQMASEKLGGKKYNSVYVKLSSDGKVLKIDMFTKDIERVIDALATVSIKGYPYPLLKAHIDARISSKDRERIMHLLNMKKTIEWWPNQLS